MAATRPPAKAPEWADYLVPTQLSGVELMRAHYTGHVYDRHSHDTYSIGVTEAGVQAFTCRGGVHASTAGQIMTFNPDEPHDGRAGVPEGFTYRMLYIQPDVVRRVIENAHERSVGATPFARTPVVLDRQLSAAIVALHDAISEAASRLECDALLDETILCFARRHSDSAFVLPAASERAASVRRVRDVLHDTALDIDVASDDLTRAAQMSRFHLCREFRRAFGLPPHAYRLNLRLAAAKRLLGAGEPPAAVAAALGFTDQSHLTKRFKRAYGITPGQFAAAYRRA